MKLHEINQALEDILNDYIYLDDDQIVDANTGEVLEGSEADEVINRLLDLQMEREIKLENIACWVKGLDAEVNAIKDEEKNLGARRRSLERKRERIFTFLYQSLDGEKINSPRVKVSYRKTAAVDVFNMSEIPDAFKRIKTIEEPDKTAIKEAIKAGEEVPGAALVERLSMSIK